MPVGACGEIKTVAHARERPYDNVIGGGSRMFHLNKRF